MSPPPTVCFVVAGGEADQPPAVATAAALARRGWTVHLLVCDGDGIATTTVTTAAAVVTVHLLEEIPATPDADAQRFGGDHPTLVLGERAQEAVERLHAEHRFDLVEFADAGALGMRSVQSKRSADLLVDAPIAIRLSAPAFLRRAEELRILGAPRDLKLDFCERYAFERADVQLAASDDLLSCVERRGWKVRPGTQVVPGSGDGGETDESVEDVYRELVGRPAAASATPSATPTLTVVVAHYNHEDYLESALGSLSAQTRPPDEVIVIDDGSTSEAALRVFAEQEARHPDWRFIRQENAGPGATRNRGLELASGKYFLPFDSDNVAVETMVERLMRAMEHNPSRAATACHNVGFTKDEEIRAGHFVSRYSPTGGPLVLAAVENVFGDTCSIFDTEALRSVGGFEVNRWSPTEDWETFVKMATRGLEIDVLPRPLFYYRTDSGGRLQQLGTDRGTKLRLRTYLLDEFFAAATLGEVERRELFESLQAFDDVVNVGVEARLAEQRHWHDSQMADLDAYRERQVDELRSVLGEQVSSEGARAEAELVRAEAAERELASLRKATSGWLLRRVVRWRAR